MKKAIAFALAMTAMATSLGACTSGSAKLSLPRDIGENKGHLQAFRLEEQKVVNEEKECFLSALSFYLRRAARMRT